MLVNRDGRFRAQIRDAGVGETGPNKLTTWTAAFLITEEWNGREWVDISAEGMTVTGFFYIEKGIWKDGKCIGTDLNEFQIEMIKKAIGWDGCDLSFLQGGEYPPVQIVVEHKEYNGKVRPKVEFINPYDSEGGGSGVIKSDDQTLKKINSRLGMKLRALSGGSNAAPKTPPKPKAPPAPKKMTQEEAWEKFFANGVEKGGLTEEQITELWTDELEKGASFEALAEFDFERLAEDIPF